jgi:hypothetical protein
MKKTLTLAASLAALTLTGCGFTVNPQKPASMPRADAPAPLRVGVMAKNDRYEWSGVGMSAERMEGSRGRSMFAPIFTQLDDRAPSFVRALKDSGAFRRVDEVKSLGFEGDSDDEGGHDLLIDAKISGKYEQDPGMFGKAFITGFLFFLPAPFVTYDDRFTAAADVSVYAADGRLLHRYEENLPVAMSAMLFSAGMPSSLAAGIETASANLSAKLVQDFIDDRRSLTRAVRRPARAPQPVVSAPPPPPPPEPVAAPISAPQLLAPAAAPQMIAPATASTSAPEPRPAADAAPAETPETSPAPSNAPVPHITSSAAAAELLP